MKWAKLQACRLLSIAALVSFHLQSLPAGCRVVFGHAGPGQRPSQDQQKAQKKQASPGTHAMLAAAERRLHTCERYRHSPALREVAEGQEMQCRETLRAWLMGLAPPGTAPERAVPQVGTALQHLLWTSGCDSGVAVGFHSFLFRACSSFHDKAALKGRAATSVPACSLLVLPDRLRNLSMAPQKGWTSAYGKHSTSRTYPGVT